MRFYPFSELLTDDDYFVFHPSHAPCMLISPFYRKVDRLTYENTETGRQEQIEEEALGITWVSKIPIPSTLEVI